MKKKGLPYLVSIVPVIVNSKLLDPVLHEQKKTQKAAVTMVMVTMMMIMNPVSVINFTGPACNLVSMQVGPRPKPALAWIAFSTTHRAGNIPDEVWS